MADVIQTLVELKNGKAAIDCNRKFSELISAVLETAKKGVITIKLDVTPSEVELGKVTRVEVKHMCVVTKPEIGIGSSLFYTTQDGELSRSDPAQMEFEMREEQVNG